MSDRIVEDDYCQCLTCKVMRNGSHLNFSDPADQPMSRTSAAKAYLRQENKKYPEHCIPVPREEWPASLSAMTVPPVQVWRSRTVLVQVYPQLDGAIRLSVSRTGLTSGGAWADDLTWERLQDVKRECGLGDRAAVEIYPPDDCIVNVANMRHLWILDKTPRFMWGSHTEVP